MRHVQGRLSLILGFKSSKDDGSNDREVFPDGSESFLSSHPVAASIFHIARYRVQPVGGFATAAANTD